MSYFGKRSFVAGGRFELPTPWTMFKQNSSQPTAIQNQNTHKTNTKTAPKQKTNKKNTATTPTPGQGGGGQHKNTQRDDGSGG